MRRAFTPALVAVAVIAALVAGAPGAARADDPCRARRYRGPAIDLEVKDAELHDVFRLLAQVGGVNIVVGDDVKGSVTLRLRGVPWEQVLCTVARVKRLRVTLDGSLYLVNGR